MPALGSVVNLEGQSTWGLNGQAEAGAGGKQTPEHLLTSQGTGCSAHPLLGAISAVQKPPKGCGTRAQHSSCPGPSHSPCFGTALQTQNQGISQLLQGWKVNPLPCPLQLGVSGFQAMPVDGLEPWVCSTTTTPHGEQGSRSCLAALTYPGCDHDDQGEEAGTHHVPHPSAVQLQGHGN